MIESIESNWVKVQRRLSEPIVSLFMKTPITPNQMTVGRFLFLMIPALILFGKGDHLSNIVAIIFCALFSFFDFVDGGLARRKKMMTELGAWLDPILEAISQNLILFAVTLGAYSSRHDLIWLIIGLLAFLGHSLATILYTQYGITFGFDAWQGLKELDKKFLRSKNKVKIADRLLKSIIDQSGFLFTFLFTFRYLLVLGAVFNLMPYALLLITITSHLRWTVLFLVYAETLREKKKELLLVRFLKNIRKKRERERT
jgi:phosphatidylglycerophosphate synthase